MNKVDPNNVAKWFCSQGIIENPNSIEGNMKVQKLLFFAQLIYMAKNNGETMFDEEFNAFEHGVVLEDVRKNYKHNYIKEISNINLEQFDFNNSIITALELTKAIFGHVSAQELSELSHEFESWKDYYQKSKKMGIHIKKLSKIPYSELIKELYKIEEVLDAYKQTSEFDYGEGSEDY